MPQTRPLPPRLHAVFHAGAIAAADGLPRDQNPYPNPVEYRDERSKAWLRGFDAVERLKAEGVDPNDAVSRALNG